MKGGGNSSLAQFAADSKSFAGARAGWAVVCAMLCPPQGFYREDVGKLSCVGDVQKQGVNICSYPVSVSNVSCGMTCFN